MTTIETTFFGNDAWRIEQYLGFNHVGDTVDVDTKLVFTKRSRNGRIVIEMEFDI